MEDHEKRSGIGSGADAALAAYRQQQTAAQAAQRAAGATTGTAASSGASNTAGTAAESASKATQGTAAKAGGAVIKRGGLILTAANKLREAITTEEGTKKLIFTGLLLMAPALSISLVIAGLFAARSAPSLDPIERGTWSVYDTDFEDYPSYEEALSLAINAINAGIEESFDNSIAGLTTELENKGIDSDLSIANSNFDALRLVRYNPFKILAAWQIVFNTRDYEPEKLTRLLADANLFPYTYTAQIPITKQNLFKTENTPIAEINGQAWDEPITVPAYTLDENGEKVYIDWNGISAGQDWRVLGGDGETVTIGASEETAYTEIKVVAFDEDAALRAIGYDDEKNGDDVMVPDGDRATTSTKFMAFRELWQVAELLHGIEENEDILAGGIHVEISITDDDKTKLLEYCATIKEKYADTETQVGGIREWIATLIESAREYFRPAVQKMHRVEPSTARMQELQQICDELSAGISGWVPGEVNAEQAKDATETLIMLREVAFLTILPNETRNAIMEATREAINILDGLHYMTMDAYVDPITGELIIAEYGAQNIPYLRVTGEMSEEERALRERIINTARGYLGTPYGTGSGRLDCSGLVKRVYSEVFGASAGGLQTVAAGQGQYCENAGVVIDQSSLRPGDLIFWAFKRGGYWVRPERYRQISHVGIYVDGNIIDASSANGKTVYRNLISPGSVVFFGAPLYVIAGITPGSGGSGVSYDSGIGGSGGGSGGGYAGGAQDTHGVIQSYDRISETPIAQKTVNVRYYCDCEKCGYTGTDMYGSVRTVGAMSMCKNGALAFYDTTRTDQEDNDPLGTIGAINGTLYKCVDYNTNQYKLDTNTVLIYVGSGAQAHHEAVQLNYDKPVATFTIYRYGQS